MEQTTMESGVGARFKSFLKRPSTVAFGAFTLLYAICMGGIFWGTWSLDRAPVEPDNAITYAVNDAAQWFKALCGGKDFIPSDLMRVLGGMYFWQELQYALAGWLAALGMAFYLRGRKLSLFASYAGGAAYGLMGYTFTLYSAGHLGWFLWMMYGPFAFGLVDRAVRKGKWLNWTLLGAVLAWGAARQPDMWLLFTLLTFAYGLWSVARVFKTVRWARLFAGVGVTAAVALAIGLPQFGRAIFQDLAGREAQIASTGAKTDADGKVGKSDEERWLFCTSWSLPPEDTLEFIAAEIHGGSNDPRVSPKNPYKGRLGQQIVVPANAAGQRHPVTGQPLKAGERIWMPYRQHSLYFGLLSVLFAFAGCVGWWKFRTEKSDAVWRDAPFWMGAAALLYLCALGGFTPFYKIVYALPFGSTMRCPVKFVHLLEWCVAVLAGLGFEAAWRGFKRDGAAAMGLKIAVLALAVINVIDLARVDAKYCAVEDVTFQRLPNDAAADVIARGGGKVFVAIAPQEGGRLIRDSLGLNLAETTDSMDDPETRFVLANGTTLRKDASFNEKLKRGELRQAGMYTLYQNQGIRRASGTSVALALFEKPSVGAPAPKPEPAPKRGAQLLTLVSVLSSLGVAVWALLSLRRRSVH